MALGRDDPPTEWTRIRTLESDRGAEEIEAAWRALYERYGSAMTAFARALLRGMANPFCTPDEAEDVVQSFFLACLEKGWLSRADPSMGRFRVFVRVLLRRFVTKHVAARTAQRRAPKEGGMQDLDGAAQAMPSEADTDTGAAFDEAWAACLAEAAVRRTEARSARNAEILTLLWRAGPAAVAELLTAQGVPEGQQPVAQFRARKMFAQELWAEVKETVGGEHDLEIERAQLLPYLARYLDEDAAPSLHGGLG